MTGYDVSDHDMPNFLWPGRRDVSAIEDAALAALLSGQEPEDLPAGLQPAADVLAALKARPSGDELAGEMIAMAEFRQRVGVSAHARRSTRRRPALLTSLMSAKVAVAAAAVAIAVGGIATAAYAGALPATAQSFAHDWIGAPTVYSHPAGPSAGQAAKFAAPSVPAPCVAYWHAARHGTAAQKAAAYATLEQAAGGADKIAAYCRPARHQHRPHFRRYGCWTPVPNASWSPGPQPSWSPSPQPSASATPVPSPSCTQFPHPSYSPRPYKPRPPLKHRHFPPHHGKPGRPFPHPTPSAYPTPTPSA
jgi:hypothetical protein